MAFSWQESVKPAGTQDIQCDIEYLDKSYIHVYLDGAETTAFTWTSSTNIRLNSPLSAETAVLLIRKTEREYLYIEFASGAPFIEGNVDTQNTQFLHLAQELVEGRSIEGFYGDINMHRYRITNLGDPVDARDAANKQYVDAGDARLDQRIDAEHAAWMAAVANEASIRKAADDALDVRTTNLEQTYFNANTNSFPWWTVLAEATDTVVPGMPFTKAAVRLNGVTQTAGYSYTVAGGVITFAEVIPAGTLVDVTIGVDTEADTSAVSNVLGLLGEDSGATRIGYKHPVNQSIKWSVANKLSTVLSLFDFIPESLHAGIQAYTYTGDLSVYVQRAIDTANSMGGATIMCPAGQYYMNVQTKQNVILIGARANTVRRAMPWAFTVSANPGSTRFRNYSGSDWVIKSATGNQGDVTSRSFGIIGIDFDAKDASNSTGGVRLRGPEFCVKSCSFYGFQDQGLEASGNIGLVEDVIANNCLLNRVRSSYVGTVEISGASDCQIHRVEGNAQVVGLGNITNAEPYICGIKIAGNNHYVSGLMGEISETGIYLSASSIHHKVSDCRADNNTGPGYLLNGVMLINSHSYNNSRAGSGLYSAFAALPNSTRFMLSNCLAWTDTFPVDGTGQQRMHKYGYDIAVVDTISLRFKPWINQCFSYGHSDSWINEPPTYGMQYTPYIGLLRIVDNATTTPNVDGVSVVSINTTSLSEITGLSGGTVGQTVDIYLNATATVTLRNSVSFLVNNFAANNDKVMVRGKVYKFIKTASNIWREVGDAPRTYYGTTAERPSTAAVPGMHYFDTTLNKPIWRNAANSGWVDSTGTAV